MHGRVESVRSAANMRMHVRPREMAIFRQDIECSRPVWPALF